MNMKNNVKIFLKKHLQLLLRYLSKNIFQISLILPLLEDLQVLLFIFHVEEGNDLICIGS